MRIVLLLSIFFVILFGTWLTEKRMAAWDRPILVTVYPVVADGSLSVTGYVGSAPGQGAFAGAFSSDFEMTSRKYLSRLRVSTSSVIGSTAFGMAKIFQFSVTKQNYCRITL